MLHEAFSTYESPRIAVNGIRLCYFYLNILSLYCKYNDNNISHKIL